MNPRAVLADDERLMRDQLRTRLREVWPELELVAEARNGQEAVDAVRDLQPDVVFLDIRMPGMTGIEAAREIVQIDRGDDAWPPEIVFITAYDQYAVEAFDQGAVDYVLKPADRERLQRTVDRIRQRLASRGGASEEPPATLQHLLHRLAAGAAAPAGAEVAGIAGAASPGSPARATPLRWIQASVGSTLQMIPVDDVLFFISDEKYTRVQTATIEALIRKPIKELVDELDPDSFWQIHRSTLVNVQAIAGVTRDLRGRQIVSIKGLTEKLEVSRSFSGLFKGM